MKKAKIIFTAAILIFAITLFSCGDDAGGGLGLLGGKDVKTLPNFDGSFTTNTSDLTNTDLTNLLSVLDNSTSFINMLSEANTAAYNAAFLNKYGKTQSAYFIEIADKKTGSVSVDINDNDDIFKTKANVTKASIKGSSKGSISSNLTLGEILPYFLYSGTSNPLKDKDWISISTSTKKTFAITEGFYTFTKTSYQNPGTYKVAGYITVQDSSSAKSTMTDKTKDKTEGSSNKLNMINVTLAISRTNGGATTGAKFRISASSETNGKARYVEGSNAYNYSDIEVYNEKNEKIKTITSSSVYSNLLDLADYLTD